MKYFTLILLSLISLSLFSQQLSQKDSISLLLLNQEYEIAISQCENILQTDSSATWAWAPMGQAKQKLTRYKEALGDFQKAVKYFPENLPIKYSQGASYSQLGDYAKASDTYLAILKIDNNQLLARIELAKSYYNGKKYTKAIPIYQQLLKKYPGNYTFNKELGLTYMNLDSLKKATWFMHNATNINNRDQGLIAKLATLHNQEGDYGLALSVVKLGRMHDSTSLPLISLEGYCNYLLQRYMSAIDLFKLARSLGDSSVFTAKYLGISYVYIQNEAMAIPLLKIAIPLLEMVFQADSSANNCYHLGMAHYGLENFDTAYNYFVLTQKLMEPIPTVKASVHQYMAGSLTNLKNYPEALKNYQLAYKLDPSDYGVLYNIASVYDHYLGEKKKALEYYEKFLARSGFDSMKVNNVNDYVSISLVAHQRATKIREDLHFEGELNK